MGPSAIADWPHLPPGLCPNLSQLPVLEQVINGQADVLGNLAQEDGRDIATRVERHGGGATVGMTKLLMRV